MLEAGEDLDVEALLANQARDDECHGRDGEGGAEVVRETAQGVRGSLKEEQSQPRAPWELLEPWTRNVPSGRAVDSGQAPICSKGRVARQVNSLRKIMDERESPLRDARGRVRTETRALFFVHQCASL